jgi:tetratricopeptide (TPR) repeat protein
MLSSPRHCAYWWIHLTLVFLTLAVFIQVLGFEFVSLDDKVFVSDNPSIREGLTLNGITWAFQTMFASNWHPLTWISFLVDYEIFGLNPMGYHLTNLLLHTLNVCLLFAVLRDLTGSLYRSALVAALFAVHPLHVESVAWVIERKDVLSTFFGILGIRAYHRYVRRPGVGRYLAVAVLLALGLMAKPMLVSWPIVLLLLDYWPLERLGPGQWLLCLKEKIPLAMLAAISCLLTVIAQHSGGATHQPEDLSFGFRVANALVAYQNYLAMALFPTGLACFYPYSRIWNFETVFLAGLLLAGVSVLLVLKSRQYRYLLTGWLWYLITLLPVIGLIQVGAQAMADRYTYVPLIGVFVMATWGGADLIRWMFRRTFSPVAQGMLMRLGAVFIVGVLATCAWAQTSYWKNSISLFEHALRVTENNSRMHYCMGIVLLQNNLPKEAGFHFGEAVRIEPNYSPAHYHYGVFLAQEGLRKEARFHLGESIRLGSTFPQAYNNLGILLMENGEFKEALDHFEQAVRMDPNYAEAQYNLGTVLMNSGKIGAAMDHFCEAIRIQPDCFAAHFNWGIALAKAGLDKEAAFHFRKAIQLKPNSNETYFCLGKSLLKEGGIEEAVQCFRKTLQLKPDYVPALDELAWVLATANEMAQRNGPEAVQLAEKARQLTGGKEARPLAILAAAYAEAGRFSEAIAAAQQSMALARAKGNEVLLKKTAEELRLYRQRRPIRNLAKLSPVR